MLATKKILLLITVFIFSFFIMPDIYTIPRSAGYDANAQNSSSPEKASKSFRHQKVTLINATLAGIFLSVAGFASAIGISARKISKIENNIKKTNRLFAHALDSLDDFLIVVDRNFKVLKTNISKFNKELSFQENAYCYEILKGSGSPCPDCQLNEVFKTGKVKYYNDKCSFGIYKKIKAVPIFDSKNKVECVIKIARPELRSKKITEAIDVIKNIFEIVHEEVCLTDKNFSIVFANSAYKKSFGNTGKKFKGSRPFVMDPSKFAEDEIDKVIETLKTGCTRHNVMENINSTFESRELLAIPLGINEEFPLYIFISAPAQIDEKQSHNNRIALLGFTAGSIIHDFNNILMMIISNAEIIRSNLNNPEKSEKAIDRIIKASDRAGELINGIEKITRRDIQSQPGPVNIFKTVNETVNEFEIILSENMSMEKNIDENTAEIIADETEIYQLLMNLLSNSVKAVKQAGDEKKLKISLENFEPENFLLAEGLPESLRKGKYVKLSVSDSGAGIPRKTLEKIYEPFFTTALNGKGSGLGLAIVKDIVNKNKGEIIVNSTPGEGTVFNVYLPALEKKRRK